AALAEGQRGQLRLSAGNLQAGDTELGDLQLAANGTPQAHQATMQVEGGLLDLSLAVDGGLSGADWRGRLHSAELQAEGQQWALRQPASLERLASGQLTVGAHCWVSGPASLCADNQRLLPDPQLRYRLRDFPLQSLAGYLPDNLRWLGE